MPAVPRLEAISQSVAISGFTDDGGTSGHIDLDDRLPIGSIVLGWKADITIRFTGGKGNGAKFLAGTPGDTDAFSAGGEQPLEQGSPSAFGDVPRPDGVMANVNATRIVRLTVGDGIDFGNIAGGALTFSLYYVRTVA